MRTLVGINNLTAVGQPAYGNHLQVFYRLGKDNPEHNFMLCNPRRMTIDAMRNFAARSAMEYECDYLMFLDDDVLAPVNFNFWKQMVDHDKDILSGITFVRGYPYRPMVFSWNCVDTGFHIVDYKDHIDDSGLVPCDAVGFSLVLIKVELLKKIQPPYFVTGVNHTEDVYFCRKVREQFPDTTIFADPRVETLHQLEPDFIGPENLEARKLYDETLSPELKKQTTNDRGEEYLEECQKVLKT
jgi:hypothetical protein